MQAQVAFQQAQLVQLLQLTQQQQQLPPTTDLNAMANTPLAQHLLMQMFTATQAAAAKERPAVAAFATSAATREMATEP